MRAGLSTIQQTLTAEAATVLNHSISEASRRNHGQTTPLHVAATLLSSPTGYLRQACIKSHPNSSHPLQCRALELCFSVALERLPTSQNPNSNIDPPISNALMAALKRAQAHQRRGCPEQQQQPLLAVKVELEQLIISILDDPSVSRVMREASFSSPAVKGTIEQSLINSQSNCGNSASVSTSASSGSVVGLGFRTPGSVPIPVPVPIGNRSLYLNPRLQQGSGNGGVSQSGQYRGDEVKRVLDILVRSKKKNPILVGESEPEVVVKQVLRKVQSKEIGDGLLKNVEVIHLDEFLDDKGKIAGKIADLSGLIEARIGGLDCGGLVVDLGDLKWLVEQPVSFAVGGGQQQPQPQPQPQHQLVSEAARAAVAEMGKLLKRFGEGDGRVWLIGTATCETYLRCQVYHPSMENDWDLQAVPIAPRAPTGVFPRFGNNGILSSTVESLSPLKSFPSLTAIPTRRLTENLDPARRNGCCPQCMQNYEQDLAKILPKEEKSSEVKLEPTQPSLPQWLKNAKSQDGDLKTSDQTVIKDQEQTRKQKTLELQKKWHDTCLHLHPGYHHNNGSERLTQPVLSMTSLYNPNLVPRQPFLPKAQLERNRAPSLQMNPNLLPRQPSAQVTTSPPGSPVRTDLVLGRPKFVGTSPEKVREVRATKDFLGCVPSEPQTKLCELQTEKCSTNLDADSFKKLLKGLAEMVWWQREAASAVATTVTNCKLGNGRRRGAGAKGDTWLLFTGPDRVGKKKMASALSDLVWGTSPVIVHLGSRPDDGESDMFFRGKTALDRIAEAVRRNPFSVIVLEDVDEADLLVRGSIKQAMERGRLADSHGREISLGNIIFILTANWLPENLNFLSSGISLDEKKLHSLASGGWQLRLTLSEKTTKRRASWSHDESRPIKSRSESGLSFDLNEAADADDDKADGSHNSSDLTVDHEDEHVLNKRLLMPTTSSVPRELLNAVDDSIVFKPVDFTPLQRNISSTITKKFSTIMGEQISVEIQQEALEKILAGTWIGPTGLEEWSEKALVPSLHQLKSRLTRSVDESTVVRLELDSHSENQSSREWLPSSIKVSIEGL